MLPDHLGTTKQEAATAMRRLEETAVAAMIGWAKAATEVERLTAERDALKAQVADRGKAITDWQHACGQHQAALFDMKAERDEAKAALDRVRKVAANPRSTHGMVRDYVLVADLSAALDGSGT